MRTARQIAGEYERECLVPSYEEFIRAIRTAQAEALEWAADRADDEDKNSSSGLALVFRTKAKEIGGYGGR